MKHLFPVYFIVFFMLQIGAFAQADKSDTKPTIDAILESANKEICACADSIEINPNNQQKLRDDITDCIDKHVMSYMLAKKMLGALDAKPDANNQVNIEINNNKNSDAYRSAYSDLEHYALDNCEVLRQLALNQDEISDYSLSQNAEAIKYYDLGIDAIKNNDLTNAIKYYKKATDEDPYFAFAWDNLGLAYRRNNELDKAIRCYQTSLQIDPYGKMPLQNLAVAYIHKNEYNKAIEVYERIIELDKDNPEGYYGIATIYALHLEEYQKGLGYLCKAFNIYTNINSPLRADAEKIMIIIYQEMKAQGKENVFVNILASHDIHIGKEE